MGLDELIGALYHNSEFLKKLPIVKWLFIGNDLRSTIQSAHFIKKYANFIGQISTDKTIANDDKKLHSVLSDDQIRGDIVDNTILCLDRFHSAVKAKLLGELFIQTFAHKKFEPREYNSLMFTIELIHPFEGLETLKHFYEYRLEMESEEDDNQKRKIWERGARIPYQTIATTGLLDLPNGGASTGNLGGAYLNDLGKKFYECVVVNCKLDSENA